MATRAGLGRGGFVCHLPAQCGGRLVWTGLDCIQSICDVVGRGAHRPLLVRTGRRDIADTLKTSPAVSRLSPAVRFVPGAAQPAVEAGAGLTTRADSAPLGPAELQEYPPESERPAARGWAEGRKGRRDRFQGKRRGGP